LPPIEVIPGIPAAPQLTSTSMDVTCTAADAGVEAGAPAVSETAVQFFYSGPVCQPIPVSSVTVGACKGTFPSN
jgi:hypothetical protein